MSGKANIKITADSKDAESGIKKVSKELDSFANKVKKSSVTSLATSFTHVGQAVKLTTDAVKKVNAAVKETVELAQKQQKAEIQLSAAAKNNPYLTDASVAQLKQYAGELQSISTIGDEQLLPMMSELAAAGRTQAEIQDIMKAALDLSASGMMSMESAVSALNGTLQGNVGTLGKQISGIKELSAEELKSGKAIEIIKKQFDGMSESITEQTGGWQKYKNSLGDFKEVLGSNWADLQNNVGNILSSFFDTVTSKMKVAKQAAEEFKAELNLIATNDSDQGTVSSLQSEIDLLNKQNEQYENYKKAISTTKSEFVQGEKEKQNELQKTYDEWVKQKNEFIEQNTKAELGDAINFTPQMLQTQFFEAYPNLKQTELYSTIVFFEEEFTKLHPEIVQVEEDLNKQKEAVKKAGKEWKSLNSECTELGYSSDTLDKRIESNKKRIEELTPKLKEAQSIASSQEEADAVQAEIDARNKLRAEYDLTIEKKKEEIRLRKEAGEKITEEKEAQELFNMAVNAYVKMMSDPAFKGNKGTYTHEVNAREDIAEWARIAEGAEVKENGVENAWKHHDEIVNAWQTEEKETLEIQKAMLKEYEEYLDKKDELTKEEKALKKNIQEAQENIDKEMQKEQKENFVQTLSDIQNYINQFADITNSITDLIRQNNEAETNEEMTAISEQYTDGLISYEEYCDKKKELNKKAAKEEYKLRMWEWTASFLQATASIAQGVAASLKVGGVTGSIMAALTAAAGAVQIATIIANKPKAPSFATGGIVPGTSYSGDRVQANVNSGEMILNAQQQANLWRAANSSGSAGGVAVNMPVTIENHTDSNVGTEMTKDGLVITITEIVNAQMKKGAFTDSMDIAQNRKNGVSYL